MVQVFRPAPLASSLLAFSLICAARAKRLVIFYLTILVVVVNADLHNAIHPLLSHQQPLCTLLLRAHFFWSLKCNRAVQILQQPGQSSLCLMNVNPRRRPNQRWLLSKSNKGIIQITLKSFFNHFFVVIRINRTQTSRQKCHKFLW